VLIVVAILALAVTSGVTALVATGRQSGSGASPAASPASVPSPTAPRQQVTLPFGGDGDRNSFYPQGVAVDTQGNVYAIAVNDGMLKLAPGAQESTQLPFSSWDFAVSGGIDGAGNAYLADDGNAGKGRVQMLTPDGTQTELPFTGLGQDPSIAVAADGTVYVADGSNNRVLQLTPDAAAAALLSFTGLSDPRYVAVDSTGTVYVSDRSNSRIVVLSAGSTTQTVLPLPVSSPQGVAVDDAGNVYVVDPPGVTVLAKDSQQAAQLPVTGLGRPLGIAVDAHRNIYIGDEGNHQVVELKT
jgi:sugar lactone lactonase YvrE